MAKRRKVFLIFGGIEFTTKRAKEFREKGDTKRSLEYGI